MTQSLSWSPFSRTYHRLNPIISLVLWSYAIFILLRVFRVLACSRLGDRLRGRVSPIFWVILRRGLRWALFEGFCCWIFSGRRSALPCLRICLAFGISGIRRWCWVRHLLGFPLQVSGGSQLTLLSPISCPRRTRRNWASWPPSWAKAQPQPQP